MKKLQLIAGIALFIITTTIVVMFPFVIPYSDSNLALVSVLSIMGYFSAYMYIDMYLLSLEYHHYTKGYNDGLHDAATDVINVYQSTH